MKAPLSQRQAATRAFSLLELLATIGIIALLAALLLPVLQDSQGKAKRTRCANNLRQIGVSFQIWAHEHENQYPMGVSTNQRGTFEYGRPGGAMLAYKHFQAISNELGETKVLLCPVDTRSASAGFVPLQNANVSFAVNIRAVMGNPDAVLAADRNVRTSGRMFPDFIQFGPGDNVEWSSTLHVHRGNVLYGDGHVTGVLGRKTTPAMTTAGEVLLALPTSEVLLPETSTAIAVASTEIASTQFESSGRGYRDPSYGSYDSPSAISTGASDTPAPASQGEANVLAAPGSRNIESLKLGTGDSNVEVSNSRMIATSPATGQGRPVEADSTPSLTHGEARAPVDQTRGTVPAAGAELAKSALLPGNVTNAASGVGASADQKANSTGARVTYGLLLVIIIAILLETERRRRHRRKKEDAVMPG